MQNNDDLKKKKKKKSATPLAIIYGLKNNRRSEVSDFCNSIRDGKLQLLGVKELELTAVV